MRDTNHKIANEEYSAAPPVENWNHNDDGSCTENGSNGTDAEEQQVGESFRNDIANNGDAIQYRADHECFASSASNLQQVQQVQYSDEKKKGNCNTQKDAEDELGGIIPKGFVEVHGDRGDHCCNNSKDDENDKDKAHDSEHGGGPADHWMDQQNDDLSDNFSNQAAPGAFSINRRPNGAPRMRVVEHTTNRLRVAALPMAIAVDEATSMQSVIVDAQPLEPLLPWYRKRIFQGFIALVCVLVAMIAALVIYISRMQNPSVDSASIDSTPASGGTHGSGDSDSADEQMSSPIMVEKNSFVPSPAPFDVLLSSVPSLSPSNSLSSTGPHKQREALVDLFNHTNGRNWTTIVDWDDSDEPICKWDLIKCDDYGGVTKIDLSNNNLDGIIPSSIGKLKHLKSLKMNNNQLRSTIPMETWMLDKLEHLDLSKNHFSGSISTMIGNLPNIEEILLWSNSLNSNIPSEIGKLEMLHTLDLDSNALSGFLPIEIGSLSGLKTLTLSKNSLSSSIPLSFGGLSKIKNLGLGCNSFTGTIPAFFGSFEELRKLDVSSNDFTGSMPKDVCAQDEFDLLAADCEDVSSCDCCNCDVYCYRLIESSSDDMLRTL